MRVPRPTPRPAPRTPRGSATRGSAARGSVTRGSATRGSGGRVTQAQRAAQTRQAVRAMQASRARATATDNRMLTAMSTERASHRRHGAGGTTFGTVRPRGNLPVAAFVGLLGGFVATAGAGSSNGFVSAIGLGIAISGVVYGLFTVAQRRIATMVPGTAHIVSATAPPVAATHGRCEMHLVVQAPRLSATAVRHRHPSVPVAKWPTPGGILPVVVDPRDPRDLRIRWDKVRPHGETAEQDSTSPAQPAQAAPDATAPEASRRPTAPAKAEVPGSAAVAPVAAANDASPAQTPLEGILETSDGAPVDLSFLPGFGPPGGADGPAEPSQLSSLLESDPLLVEYGSPVREVGVTLIVSDLKQSLEFYRDLLGFFEIESGPDMVLLEARTGRLVLRQRDDAEPKPPRLMHLTLEVNDIDSAHRTLAKRGVEFLDEPRTVLAGELLELLAVSFHDPDGHGVALTSWLPRTETGDDKTGKGETAEGETGEDRTGEA